MEIKKNQLQEFLQRRKEEVLEKLVSSDAYEVIEAGFNLIEIKTVEHFAGEFSPRVMRYAEMLEVLLFSFVQHAHSFELMNQMEKTLAKMGLDKMGARSLEGKLH